MYTLLKEYANILSSDAITFASELVSTPSPSLCEQNAARLVERRMSHLGFDKVITDDFGNVIGIMYGIDSHPTVLLNSHMDTVLPGKGETIWEMPPYSGAIENHRLHGLGSSDCKSGVAMQMYAAYLLKKSLLPLRGTLVVAATVSEENGLSLGVQHLLSKTLPDMKIKVDYAVLGEPTNLGLFYGHDGWAEFRIGLGSTNPDSLQQAAEVIFQNLTDASRERVLEGGLETMRVGRPEIDVLTGSAGINLNRRLFAEDDSEGVAEKLRDYSLRSLEQYADRVGNQEDDLNLDIRIREEIQKLNNGESVQVRFVTDAWETDPFSPLVDRARQALESAGCKSRPGKWRLPQLAMGTAGSILTKRFGIPTIGYGPGNEDQAHAPNEFVEVDNIREGILGTASIVHSLVGTPVFGWTADMEI